MTIPTAAEPGFGPNALRKKYRVERDKRPQPEGNDQYIEVAGELSHDEHTLGVSRYNEDFLVSCTPGYYDNEGQPSRRSMQNGPHGKGPNPYFKTTKAWRDAGDMAGMLRN